MFRFLAFRLLAVDGSFVHGPEFPSTKGSLDPDGNSGMMCPSSHTTVPSDTSVPSFLDESRWILFNRTSSDRDIARLTSWILDSCLLSPPTKNGGNQKAEAAVLHNSGLDQLFVADFPRVDDVTHHRSLLRGLGTTTDVRKGDWLLCLPKKCWIDRTDFSAAIKTFLAAEALSREGACSLGGWSDNHGWAIFLAEELEKRQKSYWWPYFQTFPARTEYEAYHPAFARHAGSMMGDYTEKAVLRMSDTFLPDTVFLFVLFLSSVGTCDKSCRREFILVGGEDWCAK